MKYQEIIDQMTLEEKAALMSGKGFWDTVGIERLSIPSIRLSDGPHGIRKQAGDADHLGLNASVPATCFPTAATMANSWNPVMGEGVGRYLGKEAVSQNVDVILGPGLNIKRSPLGGRNFEYFSEDPYLAGKMAAGYIRGIQSEGVVACPKHFAVNSQELRRMSNDAVLDERTFREIYTTGFEIAVKEGKAKSIMSAYNKINGVYANENEHLLKEILVDEWGFDGFVVSDWGGSNDHAAGVKAGSHLEMPTTGNDGKRLLLKAIADGTLTEEALNQRVDELLDVIFWIQEQKKSRDDVKNFDVEEHHTIAKRAAEECIVLLKNEDNILPLNPMQKVAVIGDFAFHSRYQGAGSSLVNPTRLDEAVDLWEKADVKLVGAISGFMRNGEQKEELTKNALALAKSADVVILYLGLDEVEESEGKDRNHMKLAQNQVDLLEAIAEVNNNVVVVLSAGCAIEMPWLSKVKGLIHGYLAGQAGAESIINVITGTICPSGRLAETYPIKLEDTPCYHYYPGKEITSEYREGIYVGYRYYETADVPVLFPFGFGLSYTEFNYDSMRIDKNGITVKITNIGDYAGAEVVQMYVALEDSAIFRPCKELKGFSKVYLEPGESIEVAIPFDDKTFRYFNVKSNKWEVEDGTYRIMVGANIKDIRLSGYKTVKGTKSESPYNTEDFEIYYKADIKQVSDEAFRALLGHEIPESNWNTNAPLGMNDAVCQMYYAKSRVARVALKAIRFFKDRSIDKGNPNLNLLFIYDIPFRGIAKMMGGAVSMEMAEALLTIVNGHFFRGMAALIKGAIHNK